MTDPASSDGTTFKDRLREQVATFPDDLLERRRLQLHTKLQLSSTDPNRLTPSQREQYETIFEVLNAESARRKAGGRPKANKPETDDDDEAAATQDMSADFKSPGEPVSDIEPPRPKPPDAPPHGEPLLGHPQTSRTS